MSIATAIALVLVAIAFLVQSDINRRQIKVNKGLLEMLEDLDKRTKEAK